MKDWLDILIATSFWYLLVEWYYFIAILTNIDFVNIYCYNCLYVEFSRWSLIYEVLTKICTYKFLVALSRTCAFLLLWLLLIIGCLARSFARWWLVRGDLHFCLIILHLLKAPGHQGRLPWALPPRIERTIPLRWHWVGLVPVTPVYPFIF